VKEQQRKAHERERALMEAEAREKEAASRTLAVDHQIAELEGLLRSSLMRDPRVSFTSLRRCAAVAPLDLGALGIPIPAPQWPDFLPEAPRSRSARASR
jgi:restriction system protein